MANEAKGAILITHATDQYQASFEAGLCLAAVTGDDNALAVFDFVKDNTFQDTVS